MSAEPIGPDQRATLEDHLRAVLSVLRESGDATRRFYVAGLLGALHDAGKSDLDAALAEQDERPVRGSKARKVSVSMPEELTATVQRRVGKGEFSQYVTAAVTRQLELDLLAELTALLEAEHGPVPEEFLAEAEAAWPDGG